MFWFHRTPFEDLLNNVFAAVDSYDAKFAFPICASVAGMRPELVRTIAREGHEIASHGYNHFRYVGIPKEQWTQDMIKSMRLFSKMRLKIHGFRAPYDNYPEGIAEVLDTIGIMWDGGLGFNKKYRTKNSFFKVDINGRPSKTTFIPLNQWSDDKMIDRSHYDVERVARKLQMEIRNASKRGGVIMFDLHPIRMGQPEYVDALRRMVEFAHGLGAWMPTPHEAVDYWEKHKKWKGDAEFCLLLTGDIDNWTFTDYIRRYLWRYLIGVNDNG